MPHRGIGHRITGDRTGQSNKRGTGWEVLPVAIDDALRLASSAERTKDMASFIDHYNLKRPHAAHKGIRPWIKLNNLVGFDS